MSTFPEHAQDQRDAQTLPECPTTDEPDSESAQAPAEGRVILADDGRWAVTSDPVSLDRISVDPARRTRSLDINLPVRWVGFACLAVAGALIVGDLLFQTVEYTVAPSIPGWNKLLRLADVDREASLPTWFAIVLLWSCATALGTIALAAFHQRDWFRYHWAGLALIFLAMSMDEQVLAHESVGRSIRDFADTGGILYYAWVIPAACALVPFGLLYLRFLKHLPSATARLFLLAAAFYVGGAMGIELIGSWWVDRFDEDSLAYETITTIEEIGELAGASIFFYALLAYLRDRVSAIRFDLS